MGLVALRHAGSSWTRARTCVPCTGRRILNHCVTREIPPECTLRNANSVYRKQSISNFWILFIEWLCSIMSLDIRRLDSFFKKYLFIYLFIGCIRSWLQHTGSFVATRGLSCPAACGILVPRPGIEPTSPTLEGGFLTTGSPGKSPWFFLNFDFVYYNQYSSG